MFALDRVVQVKCRKKGHQGAPVWESGSGYALENGVLLTAAHVVSGADPESPIEVRLLRSASWSKATIAWIDEEVDAALLHAEAGTFNASSSPPSFGEVKGTLAPVEAIGYPAFEVDRDLRDTEHLLGQLRLLSGVRMGLLEIDVVGQRIEADDWSGMSGAALFCQGHLVGVVIKAIEDTGRLVAQPVAKIAGRKDFQDALGTAVVPETIVGMEGPQPPLVQKALKGTPASRLAYTARVVPLIGRDQELSRLGDFLGDPRQFLWWIVTGGSGSGKSRLALEFTILHWGNWWTGFLASDPDAAFWANWNPQWPTLMVIDYVSTRAAEAGRMVNLLQERARELGSKVRVLLIARTADQPWWKEFLGKSSRSARESILGARYLEPIELPGLSPEENWAIVEHELLAARVPWSATEKHYLIETLNRIDPTGSPLYAMFLADAFRQTDKGEWDSRSATWSAESLVENVIERERVQWDAVGVTAEDERALALATMLAGLKLGIMEDPRAQGLLPSPEDYVPERFKAITGKPADEAIPPLVPALVGESFVLALPSSKIDKSLRNLARLAFEIDRPAACQFLLNACIDFRNHRNLEHLLPEDPGSLLDVQKAQAGEEEETNLTYMASVLAVVYALRGMPNQMKQVCQTLSDALKSRPDDAGLQDSLSHTLHNIVAIACSRGEMELAFSTFADIRALWMTTRAPAFAVGLANALFALGTSGIHFRDDKLTLQAVESLEQLSLQSLNPEVQAARARLLVNVSVEACKNNQIEIATSRCAQLLEIQIEGPLRAEVSRLQAKCLRNVCRAQALSGDLAGAANRYTELARIVDSNPPLLRWRVVALADLIESACRASALDEAWSRFRDLAQYGEVAELDSEARMSVNHALGNFALLLRRVPDLERADQVYFAWRSQKTEEIQACRAVWAQAGGNLVSAHAEKQEVAAAQRIHADIRRLLAIDPTDAEVAGDLGRATQILLNRMAKTGMAADAKSILATHRRDLQLLTEDTRESLYIAAVFFLLLGLTDPDGDVEQAREVLRGHQEALTSKGFTESVRAQMGAEVADEWSRRLESLMSDPPVLS
jgi:hypothetical protein